jgi:hypothetical protein
MRKKTNFASASPQTEAPRILQFSWHAVKAEFAARRRTGNETSRYRLGPIAVRRALS